MLPEIMGYRRPDGRFGIRNHIAVIATMDNANPTVRKKDSKFPFKIYR